MDEIIAFIADYLEKYPLSEPRDIVKLLYQREFGPAHAVADPEAAVEFVRREYASVRQEEGPLSESIGGGFARLDLKTLDHNGVTPEQAAEAFINSAAPAGDKAAFAEMLRALASDPRMEGMLPGSGDFIAAYTELGCPALHHSETYRTAYSPAYRVVRAELLTALTNGK
ncbi:MAG: hypothetical protein J5586_01500 [Clostridia bacterium]|nr:hypothetical protein [Clostridia bacterium]